MVTAFRRIFHGVFHVKHLFVNSRYSEIHERTVVYLSKPSWFASLSDEYRPDPSTLGPDNYVAVRLPAGSSLDEYRERFLSHPQVEECGLVEYSRGSVDALEDIRPLVPYAEVA